MCRFNFYIFTFHFHFHFHFLLCLVAWLLGCLVGAWFIFNLIKTFSCLLFVFSSSFSLLQYTHTHTPFHPLPPSLLLYQFLFHFTKPASQAGDNKYSGKFFFIPFVHATFVGGASAEAPRPIHPSIHLSVYSFLRYEEQGIRER
jgi:hypothetical protein